MWEAQVYLRLGSGPFRNPWAEQKLRGLLGLESQLQALGQGPSSKSCKGMAVSLQVTEKRCVLFLGYAQMSKATWAPRAL